MSDPRADARSSTRRRKRLGSSALASLRAHGREALPLHAGPHTRAAGSARRAGRARHPPPGSRLPGHLRALSRAAARGVPHAGRRADVHDVGHGRVRVGRGEPDHARRAPARPLRRQLRRALGGDGAGLRCRPRPRAARLGADSRAGRSAQRAGRRRRSRRLPDSFGDVDRCRLRRPGARRSREGSRGARRRRRGLQPRRRSARDRRVGDRRRRLRVAEGVDVPAGRRLHVGLAGRARDVSARDRAALRPRLGTHTQGAGEARRSVHAGGVDRARARRRARPPPRRGARGGLRPPCAPGPGMPRGREGDGPRALLSGRGPLGRRHCHLRAGRRRRDGDRLHFARPLRYHDRQRPGRAEGKDLPDRPHRLVRRLRHHHGGGGGRARAGGCRRRHRTRRRRDARARGLGRAHPRLTAVLVREEIAEAGIRLLRERGFDVTVDGDSDLAESIGRYEGIVIRSATKLTSELIERAERLKVIGRAGVGIDNVDVEAATRRGIVVANAPESTVVSAAEHTVGLLVALARNIPQAHAALKQGRWERSAWGGVELEGKTLGVLGFGRIGQQVARRALGLGMRVLAYDPFVARERFRELGAERAESADDVLAAADFLTLHLPMTAETRGFLGREAIGKLRDGVRLINAARGELVDEEALVEALRGGKIAAAAVDIFSTEPYEGPLLALDNVVTTPHLAASTEEAQDRAGVIVAEQVASALEGAVVTNAVNIPAIGAESLEALGPYIPLAARLGRLAMELAEGRARRIELTYYGGLAEHDTRLLTVAALNGAFQGRSDRSVNYVNAPLVAAERGIEVREERAARARDFTHLIRVDVDGLRVAGTLIGRDNRQWLVSALGYELDLELAPLMVFCGYSDVPRVIGRVGTLFGDAGINIASIAVSRTNQGDKALMALSIDTAAPRELVERLFAEGFDEVHVVTLDEAFQGASGTAAEPVVPL